MNLAPAFLIAGILFVAISIPLIKRKVPMNLFYGIRVDAAFQSRERWYEMNEYGGRLFLKWGIAIILTGLIGFALPGTNQWLLAYAYSAVLIILGGLGIVVCKIMRYESRLKS